MPGTKINEVYTLLCEEGKIPEIAEPEMPKVPMDYTRDAIVSRKE